MWVDSCEICKRKVEAHCIHWVKVLHLHSKHFRNSQGNRFWWLPWKVHSRISPSTITFHAEGADTGKWYSCSYSHTAGERPCGTIWLWHLFESSFQPWDCKNSWRLCYWQTQQEQHFRNFSSVWPCSWSKKRGYFIWKWVFEIFLSFDPVVLHRTAHEHGHKHHAWQQCDPWGLGNQVLDFPSQRTSAGIRRRAVRRPRRILNGKYMKYYLNCN